MGEWVVERIERRIWGHLERRGFGGQQMPDPDACGAFLRVPGERDLEVAADAVVELTINLRWRLNGHGVPPVHPAPASERS